MFKTRGKFAHLLGAGLRCDRLSFRGADCMLRYSNENIERLLGLFDALFRQSEHIRRNIESCTAFLRHDIPPACRTTIYGGLKLI